VALVGLAAAHRRLDRLDHALDAARQALAITGRTGYRVLECQAREQLADILCAIGQPGPAAAEARGARDIREATGFRWAAPAAPLRGACPARSEADTCAPASGRSDHAQYRS
jgi:hypothetical protein